MFEKLGECVKEALDKNEMVRAAATAFVLNQLLVRCDQMKNGASWLGFRKLPMVYRNHSVDDILQIVDAEGNVSELLPTVRAVVDQWPQFRRFGIYKQAKKWSPGFVFMPSWEELVEKYGDPSFGKAV